MTNSATKRVLVVEDEPLIAYDLINQIEADSHTVVGQCRTSDEAVRMAGDLKPDVIVMDIGLLGQGCGLDAAKQIRKQLGIGCIFISATLDRVDPRRWKDVEPVALISKPYRDDVLSRAIRSQHAA